MCVCRQWGRNSQMIPIVNVLLFMSLFSRMRDLCRLLNVPWLDCVDGLLSSLCRTLNLTSSNICLSSRAWRFASVVVLRLWDSQLSTRPFIPPTWNSVHDYSILLSLCHVYLSFLFAIPIDWRRRRLLCGTRGKVWLEPSWLRRLPWLRPIWRLWICVWGWDFWVVCSLIFEWFFKFSSYVNIVVVWSEWKSKDVNINILVFFSFAAAHAVHSVFSYHKT
jgi:hypothetical protein